MDAYELRLQEGHTPKYELTQTATTSAESFTSQDGAGNNQEITSLRLVNRSSDTEVLVSTDGGTNWFAVTPLYIYDLYLVSTSELQVKTSSGTASYDLFYTVKP